MTDDIEKRIKELEMRVSKIEKELSDKPEIVASKKNKYKGLAGGIRLLISNAFFNQPKSVREVIAELKREGYYFTDAGVMSTLFTTFIKSQKVLNRIKEKEGWKYVVRK